MDLDRVSNVLETSEDVIFSVKGDFNLSSVQEKNTSQIKSPQTNQKLMYLRA